MDKDKLGYLTFMNFRKILETTNFNVKDKYIEYMIYRMKSLCSEDSCLDDLRYSVINKHLENLKKIFNKKKKFLYIFTLKSSFLKYSLNSPKQKQAKKTVQNPPIQKTKKTKKEAK